MAAFTIHDAQRLSHAYIIASPDRAECLNLAGQIAAAAVCERGTDAPCGVCRGCRKAQNGIHPDIIHVQREEGKQIVSVAQIRAMTADAYVLPNEAARKVYILDEADKMKTPEAQNAALKTLEEPPAGVIFLLCAVNPRQLLPTVRSRCAEIAVNGGEAPEDEETRKLAADFVKTVSRGDEAALCLWCAKNESGDNRAAAAFLTSVSHLCAEMLCRREDDLGMSPAAIARLRALSERCLAMLRVNVGVKHIFGLLSVDAVDGSGNEENHIG